MELGKKIASIAVFSVVVTAGAGLVIQRVVIRNQGIQMIRDTMRATILSAENARRSVSALRNAKVFDDPKLKAEAAGLSDYRQSNLYSTVPVVAAWKSITEIAEKEGYEFRVPAQNPRNSKNLPSPDELAVLRVLEQTQAEDYFAVDEAKNELLYARPIVLSADCMACHGDPAQSASRDGKDILGFRMENWKAGDRHGMFLLRSSLGRVDSAVAGAMTQTAMWLVPLAICIGAGVFLYLSRITGRLKELIGELSGGSSEVSLAVEQLSGASQSLAQGASEQAAAIEQTSAASEQITAMTRRNAEHSRMAAQEMSTVNSRIQNSNSALEQMAVCMKEITTSATKIEGFIKVIDGIAFQTNILALNAAVEAARAGQAGAGFAVVADAVRELAMRSAQAAKDTAPLIAESVAKAKEGSDKLSHVVCIIKEITGNAATVKTLVEEVNQGSQEQTKGMEQVASALIQMGHVIQMNAASSEETASASLELSAQAKSMDQIGRNLHTLVAG